MGAKWDTNDYDWDPHSLEAAARPRRGATRQREEEDQPEHSQQRTQRRQTFIGCQVHMQMTAPLSARPNSQQPAVAQTVW
jgi:hypothetical protein